MDKLILNTFLLEFPWNLYDRNVENVRRCGANKPKREGE